MGLPLVALSLALFVSACGDNQSAAVDEPVVVDSGADLAVATEESVVAEEAVVTEETVDVDSVDAVSTTVMTDTVVDTDVITQVQVMTETTAADIIVEQQVMTDTDVTIDRTSDTESDLTVETEDVDSASTTAIVLLTDSAGGSFLGDPVEQRPLFVSQDDTFIVSEEFEPILASDDAIYGEGIDQGFFDQIDRDGMAQLTYNGHPLYRYTGPQEGDWRTLATDQGLSGVTSEGDMGEFAE